ncbi:hypothetical protein [Microbacterium kunmingense]|uniref:hypothetical protein n=1 Tax=Microbacterium kunmingense TaxID=2915939 RepID=UPI003D7232F6
MSTDTTAPETPDPEVPVFDAPPTVKPEFFVAGNTFYAQTENGELAIPLRFKTRLIRELRDVEGDELDQMFILLDRLNDQATADALDELDIFDTTRVVGQFFKAWREKQQASVGEAQRSSN